MEGEGGREGGVECNCNLKCIQIQDSERFSNVESDISVVLHCKRHYRNAVPFYTLYAFLSRQESSNTGLAAHTLVRSALGSSYH